MSDPLARHKELVKIGYAGIVAGGLIFVALAVAALVRGYDLVVAGTIGCAVAWGFGFGTVIHSSAKRAIAELEAKLPSEDSPE